VEALVPLVADPGMRRSLGERNRKRAEEMFSRDTMCRRMVALLEGLWCKRGVKMADVGS